MAQIEVSAEYDLAAIATAAGNSNADERRYVEGFLIVENVTQQALEAAFSAYDHDAYLQNLDRTAAELLKRRKLTAYQFRSDPIFFKWQRGEATEQDWLDEVAAIDAEFAE